jgi:hypothetical protein
MKQIFSAAGLAGIGLLSLLSACASTTSSDSNAAQPKVASANCEVVESSVGSNMVHRVCTPKTAQPGEATSQ